MLRGSRIICKHKEMSQLVEFYTASQLGLEPMASNSLGYLNNGNPTVGRK